MKKRIITGVLFTLGFVLLMAIPDENKPVGTFFIQLVLTKGAAIACFATMMRMVKRMEQDGEISIGEE